MERRQVGVKTPALLNARDSGLTFFSDKVFLEALIELFSRRSCLYSGTLSTVYGSLRCIVACFTTLFFASANRAELGASLIFMKA